MGRFNPKVCHQKQTFLTVYDANRAILLRYKHGAPRLVHYQCPVCGYLHLTSRTGS